MMQNCFSKQSILVFGDLIADIYQYGLIKRMSREAPIPIVELQYERIIPGGAGNVILNITALSGTAIPVGVLGDDESGQKLLQYFQSQKIDTEGLLLTSNLPTTTKCRILAQGEHTVRQQLLRLDRLPQATLNETNIEFLWELFLKKLDLVQAVIISDYHLPLFPATLLFQVAEYAKEHGKKVIVDSRHRLIRFKNATLLTPNRSEAEEAAGVGITNRDDLQKVGQIILEKTKSELLLITLGDEGMALFTPGFPMELIPANNRQEVFDVSGAGDTVVATITLGLLSGMPPLEAAKLANIAAGLVVRKIGTATVSLKDLLEKYPDLKKA